MSATTTSTTATPPTTNASMNTVPYQQGQDPSMAPPSQEHEHEYKQEHEHHHGVPLNQDEEEVLLARIRAQVDFYFSPQNLAQDHFLCSLLTSHEHYGAVPVQQICGFPKIRQLVAAAMHANMSGDMAQLPPADPELLCRAVAHKSDWVRVVGDAATGYWFVPFTLPDHTSHQSWYMSSQKQHQQVYPRNSHPHEDYPQHARMVSGPPPPPPQSPPKKVPTSPTTTAMTSDASASLSSSTSETTLQGTFQHVQQQHVQHDQQQHVQYPVVKERTVVLVHDISDAQAEQDIWQLFSGRRRRQDNNGSVSPIEHEYTTTTFQPKSVVQDVGRTWHVTFGTEQEATAALLASREKMYRGMPIRSGLKNDSTSPDHSAATNNYGMQFSYLHQQQLQPHWQHPTPGNSQGESQYYMPVLPHMPYGTVQHQQAHTHQQYSYGYAVVPPIIISQPVMVAGMYANGGPPHQIGYAVPADYSGNSHYQYAGAVPASPPPPPPETPPPLQQVLVSLSQPSSGEEGDAAAVVVVDDQEESTAQAKSSSQDTTATATVDGGGPQKNISWAAKKGPYNKGYYYKGGQKYQRNRGNQSWPQKAGDGQHPQQQYQGKKKHASGFESKKKGKQRRDDVGAPRNLAEEHFPVLGGSSKKKTHHVNANPKKAAYAEALLKSPVLTSVPSGEPTGQTSPTKKEHNVER